MAKKKKTASKKKAGGKKATTRKAPSKKSSSKKAATKKVTGKKAAKTATRKKAGKTTGAAVKVTKPSGKKAAAKSATAEPKVAPPRKKSKRPTRTPSPPRAPSMVSVSGSVEVDDRPALTEAQLRKVKTGLKKKDLLEYRRMLLEKRAELIGDLDSLSQSANSNNNGDLSHMPMHMADVGSDYYEQEFTLGLVESERKLLREIDEALLRIVNGTYGVCLETGEPIGRLRLDYKPWAKYCIEVVREKERRGQM